VCRSASGSGRTSRAEPVMTIVQPGAGRPSGGQGWPVPRLTRGPGVRSAGYRAAGSPCRRRLGRRFAGRRKRSAGRAHEAGHQHCLKRLLFGPNPVQLNPARSRPRCQPRSDVEQLLARAAHREVVGVGRHDSPSGLTDIPPPAKRGVLGPSDKWCRIPSTKPTHAQRRGQFRPHRAERPIFLRPVLGGGTLQV
jgi:hypothetical protein